MTSVPAGDLVNGELALFSKSESQDQDLSPSFTKRFYSIYTCI